MKILIKIINKIVVPNRLFYKVDAKLYGCQIVYFYYVVAKLSVFYLGVKLPVCLLDAKLSVFTILVPNCPVPNCPTTFYFLRPPIVRTEQAYAMDGRAVLFDYPPRL